MDNLSDQTVKSFADIAHNDVTAWIVLTLSLLITALAWQLSTVYVERRAIERFEYEVADAKFAITKRMQEYEQSLRGGVALFNATGRMVERAEWQAFVKSLNIGQNFPGLQGYGFAQWIPPGQRTEVVQGIRREGYPAFDIKPEGEREYYTAIIFLEPMDERNLRAFGYDMFSEPTRRAAMEHARDTNQASVSGRVVLVQETKQDIQAGFLMYLPVYRQDAPLATVAQRREALLGFVYSPFRIKDLMRGILGQGSPVLNFKIFDGQRADVDALLFDTTDAWDSGDKQSGQIAAAYTTNKLIELPGRTWSVAFSSRRNFEQEMSSSQPQVIAVGGLLVDVLLFAIIWSLSQQRKQVLVKATSMTKELRRSREQFRAITETAYDAIISTDVGGNIVYANPAACDIFGIPKQEIEAKKIADLLPIELRNLEQPGLLELMQADQLTKVSDSLETRGLHADGHQFPIEVSVSRWQVEDHGTYFTLLMRDITERKRIDMLQNEFISTVSHELRTPLTAIRGAIGLLNAVQEDFSQQSKELINIARDNIERLVLLVNDILDLQKLETGMLALELDKVNIADLVRCAAKDYQPMAQAQFIRIEVEEPLAQVYVLGDFNRLMQVLANLISNGIKFSSSGAVITLSASLVEGSVRVMVADNGVGIPEKFRNRIFQRFAQIDGSDTRQKGGTGLGLSICKSIIELHHGKIDYESQEGLGAKFYFDLAILPVDGNVTSAPASAPALESEPV